jgi:cell division protein FtsZ
MAKHVDTMIIVPNERLLAVVGKGIPFQDALKKADEVLLHATSGISNIISGIGQINVDFADVRTIMKDGGAALMGTGVGRGDNRAMEAAQQAISSPLLDNISIAGASGVLINVTGGDDLTLGEVTAIADIIHDAAGEDAEIIFGSVIEPAMSGEIRVTVVATGFNRVQNATTGHSTIRPVHGSAQTGTPVIPIDGARPRPVIGSAYQGGTPMPASGSSGAAPARRTAPQPAPERRPLGDLDDLEIPTFIRRQMD